MPRILVLLVRVFAALLICAATVLAFYLLAQVLP
jgi:hypothetical protein